MLHGNMADMPASATMRLCIIAIYSQPWSFVEHARSDVEQA